MKYVCGTYLIKTKQLNSVFVYFPLTTPTVFATWQTLFYSILITTDWLYIFPCWFILALEFTPRSFLSNKWHREFCFQCSDNELLLLLNSLSIFFSLSVLSFLGLAQSLQCSPARSTHLHRRCNKTAELRVCLPAIVRLRSLSLRHSISRTFTSSPCFCLPSLLSRPTENAAHPLSTCTVLTACALFQSYTVS